VSFLQKHAYLFAAILTLCIALLVFVFGEKGVLPATHEKYLLSVQTKTKEAVRLSNLDLALVKTVLGKGQTNDLAKLHSLRTNFPFYVYQNGNLIFWSDHHLVPDYNKIAGNYYVRTIDWEHGQFVANHRAVLAESLGQSYEVFSIIPLFRSYESNNNSIKSSYNPHIFSVNPGLLTAQQSINPPENIKTEEGTFAFSVKAPDSTRIRNQQIPDYIILLVLLSLLFLAFYVLRWVSIFTNKRQYETAFLLLTVFFVGIRFVMLYYSIPFTFYELDLFNPKFYAASALAPSLGDLILNLLCILILLLYSVNYFYRSRFLIHLKGIPTALKLLLAGILIFGSYWVLFWVYIEINNLYEKSQYFLDLTLRLYDTHLGLKIAALGVYFLLTANYFLVTHHVVSLCNRFCPKPLYCIALWLLSTLACGFIWYQLDLHNLIILLIHGVFFLVVYSFNLPRFLYNFRYQTSIYFFTGAVCVALLVTFASNTQEIKQDLEYKQQFGKSQLAENDVLGEFLLDKANKQIATDTVVHRLLQTAELPREQIQEYIKKEYLKSHFDKYDIDVSVFDARGQTKDLLNVGETLAQKKLRIETASMPTEYANLFYVEKDDAYVQKKYISLVDLNPASGQLLGHVVIELTQFENANKSALFSDALTDSRLNSAISPTDYSYAIYQNNRLVNFAGTYNYEKKMPVSILEINDLYQKGITLNDYKHVGIEGKSNRKIIVSSESTPSRTYSKFSYLFLVLVIIIIVIVLGYALQYAFSKKQLNFATKIQIFLNFAFLLPLLLVVGITLTIIQNTLAESQEKTYLSQTDNIGANVFSYYKRYLDNQDSPAIFTQELVRIANESGRDISVFDTAGSLKFTSKELFYARGFQSKLLNTNALSRIVNEKDKHLLISENIGDLTYKSAYFGLKSNEGRLLGIVGVPFYDAFPTFEKDVLNVIGSILNTFTTIFLILLVVSYFASNILTVPLRLITQKIKKTNLEIENEPLEWKSDDEIGLLIGEYNRMLVKLEESKQALSMSEKQSAWREMAKQVAHEIKNPLTPMKLSLQMLQRKLGVDSASVDINLVRRSVVTMIDQIDNLSDIVTSFSDFARMPVPKMELFDMAEVMKKAVDLYAQDRNIILRPQIMLDTAWVRGDRQLISRTITNLIINAIQSVPATRKPEITLSLTPNQGSVTITCKDNGSGIPDAIKQKVFMMNFSTKSGGSGVGLAIAKRGIEHADGSIWFETVLGEGTTFFITLPLAEEQIQTVS
jgi:two-component system, NtrC family, nitrogen regulation sensor histidine kinase NtrY